MEMKILCFGGVMGAMSEKRDGVGALQKAHLTWNQGGACHQDDAPDPEVQGHDSREITLLLQGLTIQINALSLRGVIVVHRMSPTTLKLDP